MTRIDPNLLEAATSLADELDAHGIGPEEARGRLATLRACFPHHRVDLVADVEPFDGSVSYDIILEQSDGVTVSVAVTSGTGLPWPLRGVIRAREYDLLRVGPTRVSVADALASIDVLWDDRSLLLHLINACVATNALEEEPVDLTAADLQDAADRFRRAKGLLGADETKRWLDDRGLSMEKFADLVARSARAAALRQRVTSGAVERWFASHAPELARFHIAWAAEAAVDGVGHSLASRLEADPLAAVLAARRAGRPGGVGDWLVADLPHHLSALKNVAVSTAVEVEVDGVAARAIVLEVIPAVLDAATRSYVERCLFDEWLAERRRATDVEWFWGDVARTSRAA